MNFQKSIVALALIAIASPAAATVKVYDSDPGNGTPGDQVQYTQTQCPPISVSADTLYGSATLIDDGLGTVTMTQGLQIAVTKINFPDATVAFGPGAFVFIDAVAESDVLTTPAAPGSTAPGGTVAWGIVSGFNLTGVGYCIASPQAICTGAMLPHGITTNIVLSSPTYDLGTWSFDPMTGDVEGSPYITQTTNGGNSNRQYVTRGSYVGASIPALPLLGAGALALALTVAGARTLLRKK